MASISEAKAIAEQHIRAGRWPEAEQLYRNLLAQQPDQSDLWHSLGMLLHQTGRLDAAIPCYQQVISLHPRHANAYNNLGVAFKAQGQLDAAEQQYRQALHLRPDYPEVHNNLGNVLRLQGRIEAAIDHYQRALALVPGYPDAHNSLGMIWLDQGLVAEAIAHFRQGIQLHPDNADAHNNLGNALQQQDQFEAAVECYRQALTLQPQNATIHNNLGAALQELDQFEASTAVYRQAIALAPDYADAHYNLGNVLRSQGNVVASIAAYQQAIALAPDNADTHNNLGLALCEQNRLADSIAAYQQAIALAPADSNAHANAQMNMGLSLLLAGDLAAGFAAYEWRWRVQGPGFKPPREFSQPLWDGSGLTGKTILLHAEQGFGDTLQFIRYVPLVAQQGGRIVVECQQALLSLLQPLPQIQTLVAKGDPLPEFQVHAPLMSLPHLCHTTLATIPASIPYLQLPADRQISLSPASPSAPHLALRVGLVWGGSPTHGNDRQRSCRLEQLLPLLQVPGVVVYSLQKGPRTEELAQLPPHLRAAVQDLDQQLQDFADTAAAIAQLDLVITVDTAVGHLAGALGKPVWLLLSYAPDWRWMLQRDDSPWYPSLRLFRQTTPGDWAGVVERVEAALWAWQAGPNAAPEALPEQALESILEQRLALARQLQTSDLAAAQWQCQQLLRQHPNHQEALLLLGAIAYQQGNLDQASAVYQQVIHQNENHAAAHLKLGNVYRRQGQLAAAASQYRHVLRLNPQDEVACNNLGVVLKAQGQTQEAIACYRQSIALQPVNPDAHYNLANSLRAQDDLDAAVQHYQQSLADRPHHADTWNNLGNTLKEQNRLLEAIAAYRQAIALQPHHASAHHNLGYGLLLLGNLAEGFTEYEWRWRVKKFKPPRTFSQPAWDGSTLQGKRILLYAEQGFGDTIQFVRYGSLLAQQGATVLVEAQSLLARLLETVPGIAQVIHRDDPLPAFDTHASLLSLPHLLGTTLDTIPAPIPYLTPHQWGPRLPDAASSQIRVGLVWAGSPTHGNDRHRSCGLAALLPLLQCPQICFYSLQKGPATAELEAFGLGPEHILDLSPTLSDFADTAAAIAQLDLVITVDTAVGHLAGALGKPVWVLLSYAPDWRWMLQRDDSPWYPSLRLFRQPTRGDWATVVRQVGDALCQMVQQMVLPITEAVEVAEVAGAIAPAPTIAIGWELSAVTGWGVYGTHLALQLLRHSSYQPLLLLPILTERPLNPLHQTLLQPLLPDLQRLAAQWRQHPHQLVTLPGLLLKGLGNQFVSAPELQHFRGETNVGVIFFENTRFTATALAQAQAYEAIVAGSTWNADVLKSQGLTSVYLAPQGIDPTIFHPAPRSNLWGDRFIIFSGGKLEYRKGQDIVIQAFRAFHSRYPDALLLTAWHNRWPATMGGLETRGYVHNLPTLSADGRLQIQPWLAAAGISSHAVVDVGLIPNHLVGQIVREATVALFPNRCEGGTNLAAMEAMACGVPTILSANTGHQDLMRGDVCYPLTRQGAVKPVTADSGTEGWGESDVDEIVAMLEAVYHDRQQAQQRGMAAAQMMQDWTWELQVQRLLAVLSQL